MSLFRRISNLWRRSNLDSDIEAEIQSHLDLRVEEFIASGMPPDQARRAARLRFGNPLAIKERAAGADAALVLEIVWQDLRHALRQLRLSPAFTATAVVTLALGIGANTAVFSTLNALLLRMLPVRNPQNLYTVTLVHGGTQPPNTSGTGYGNTSFSFPVFQALRGQSRVFSDLIAHIPLSFGKVPVRYRTTPMARPGAEVSGNFFSGLGVPMALGSGLAASDEQQHTAKVVLSHGFWTEEFSRDPRVIGQTLYIKGAPFTIVGVTAPAFHGADPGYAMDFWIPLQSRPELGAWGLPGDRGNLYASPKWWAVPMVARLVPGISPQQAESALQSVFWQSATEPLGHLDPKAWPARLGLQPIRGITEYAHDYRTPVEIMMALVGLVLLIACTNVALLILARNAAREREFAIRMAAGARPARIFRQLLTESFVLVAIGAALGWALALAATQALAVSAQIDAGLAPDRTVLLATLGISLAVTLAFSLAPFRRTMQLSVERALRASSQNLSLSRHRIRSGNAAIAFQVAMCFTLLVAAGLTLRTLLNYQRQGLGMQADKLLIFDLNPQGLSGNTQAWSFYNRLLAQLKAVPGVESVSVLQWRLGSGWLSSGGIDLDGRLLFDKSGRKADIYQNAVGANFFHTLGVPLLAGRDFSDADVPGSPPVIIVNQEFAQRFLSHGALGHRIDKGLEIVGVAADSTYRSVSEKKMPTIYYSLAQMGMTGELTVEVRAAGHPMPLLPAIRRTIREMDPNLPLQNPMTQAAQFEKSYVTSDLFARLALGFGLLAGVLVATGVYGTLIYRLQRRRSEIGIRMALGAMRGSVLWMVLRESLLIAAAGFAAGLPLALGVAHLLRSQLYHLSAFDPASFALAAGITLLVSIAASLLPARSAAAVDPMRALHME